MMLQEKIQGRADGQAGIERSLIRLLSGRLLWSGLGPTVRVLGFGFPSFSLAPPRARITRLTLFLIFSGKRRWERIFHRAGRDDVRRAPGGQRAGNLYADRAQIFRKIAPDGTMTPYAGFGAAVLYPGQQTPAVLAASLFVTAAAIGRGRVRGTFSCRTGRTGIRRRRSIGITPDRSCSPHHRRRLPG